MSESIVTIAAFAGSLRKGSYNRMLLNAACELAPEDVRIEVLQIDDLPFYDADLDDDENPLPPVRRVREAIASADALLIVSPEYNHSIPAVTKNVLDWASRDERVLDEKPTAIMGASTGGFGTIRMQLQLRQIAGFTNQYFLNDPQVHVSRAREKFDTAGRLTDAATRKQIVELLEALAAWTRRLKVTSPV